MNAIVPLSAPTVELPITIRPAYERERRIVQSTWSRTLQQLPFDDDHRTTIGGADLKAWRTKETRSRVGTMSIDRHEIILALNARVDSILADPQTEVAVAHDPDVDECTGWACWTGPKLHFVFVHRIARRGRIATRLVLHSGCSAASHVTPEGRGLLRHLRGRSG